MGETAKQTQKLYRQFSGIDLMKFIMALFVVSIHTGVLKPTELLYYKIYRSVAYLSVPFFFIASGYLLSEKCKIKENMVDVLKQHAFKLVKLYLIWSIVYFPLALIPYQKGEHSVFYYALDYIRGFFIVGEHYNSYTLWYLLSSIYALLFIAFMKKKSRSNQVILLTGFLLGIGGCFLTLYANRIFEISGGLVKNLLELLIKIFVHGRLVTGFLYIPLGMYLHEKGRVSIFIAMLLTVGGIALEVQSIGIGFPYEFGRIIASIGIFSAAVNLDLKNHTFFCKLRAMSTTIYFIHLWIWTIVYTLIYHKKTTGWMPFLLTAAFSWLTAELWQKYQKPFALALNLCQKQCIMKRKKKGVAFDKGGNQDG